MGDQNSNEPEDSWPGIWDEGIPKIKKGDGNAMNKVFLNFQRVLSKHAELKLNQMIDDILTEFLKKNRVAINKSNLNTVLQDNIEFIFKDIKARAKDLEAELENQVAAQLKIDVTNSKVVKSAKDPKKFKEHFNNVYGDNLVVEALSTIKNMLNRYNISTKKQMRAKAMVIDKYTKKAEALMKTDELILFYSPKKTQTKKLLTISRFKAREVSAFLKEEPQKKKSINKRKKRKRSK